MKKVVDYVKGTLSQARSERSLACLAAAVHHYPRWLASLREPVKREDFIPWINFNALAFLESYLKSTMNVFEYGSGSSTIFFALRSQRVISVEHDPLWHRKVQEMIREQGLTNINYRLIQPPPKQPEQTDFTNPYHYLSSDAGHSDRSFEAYVKEIDNYPEDFFDLVFIDGRARPSCVLHALKRVKPGGSMIVDNTERDYYLQYVMDQRLLAGWDRTSVTAHVPGLASYCNATILTRKLRADLRREDKEGAEHGSSPRAF